MKNRLLILLVALLVIIQFFQPDRSVPAYDPSRDFITIMQPPAEVQEMLRVACYDCHSYQTEWPWYTYVQPVGWWIGHHVEEGREHLNFSEWGNYSLEDQAHALEEAAEEVEEGNMPLKPYTIMHADAHLSEAQRAVLVEWLEQAQPTVSE